MFHIYNITSLSMVQYIIHNNYYHPLPLHFFKYGIYQQKYFKQTLLDKCVCSLRFRFNIGLEFTGRFIFGQSHPSKKTTKEDFHWYFFVFQPHTPTPVFSANIRYYLLHFLLHVRCDKKRSLWSEKGLKNCFRDLYIFMSTNCTSCTIIYKIK